MRLNENADLISIKIVYDRMIINKHLRPEVQATFNVVLTEPQ